MSGLSFDSGAALYAVIPSSVRYDPELPANAKLLYGEISALSYARGYCFAKNRYFAELYGLNVKTISALISALSDRGHIRVEVIKSDKGEVVERRIWLIKPRDYLEGGIPIIPEGVPPEIGRGYPENSGGGTPKIPEDDNTSNIYTRNKIPPISPHEIRKRFVSFAGNNEPLLDSLLGFAEMRAKRKKPLCTERSVTLLLNKLTKLSGGDRDAMAAMLDEATEKGWSSVYLHGTGSPPEEKKQWKESLEEW